MTQALATIDSAYIAVNGQGDVTLQELLDANYGGKMPPPHKLPRVNVPAGGGLTWEIPNAAEGPQSTREITGIILHRQVTRTYYDKPFGGGGKAEPPVCKSDDGIVGVGQPGGTCSDCPLGQFNGDKRPACQEKEQIFMLLPQMLLPIVVIAPATSLKPLRDYSFALIQVAKPLFGVETKLTLQKKTANGFTWSQIVPTKTDTVISPAERERFKAMKESIIGFLSSGGQ